MSHVDEGTLHAYLDGELPSSERAALESHLAQCAPCRARLSEERALLERSTALLGSTRPLERAVPPFEQVRRAPRRPWYLRTGFAWAASLILAVGFGYFLSDSFSARLAPATSDETVARVNAETLQTAPLVITRQQDAPASAPAPRASAGRRTSAPPAQFADKSQRNESNAYGFTRESTLGNTTQPPAAVTIRGAAPLPFDSVRHQQHDTARAPEEAPLTAYASGVESRAAAAPAASRSDPRSVRNLVSTSWPLISQGKAASLLGDRPVGVPGLATREIRRSPKGDTVVVEQALDAKTVIQIFQRPATAEADELMARERADRVLSRYVGRLRVEISGPISTDSLNKLLEQVEPIP